MVFLSFKQNIKNLYCFEYICQDAQGPVSGMLLFFYRCTIQGLTGFDLIQVLMMA